MILRSSLKVCLLLHLWDYMFEFGPWGSNGIELELEYNVFISCSIAKISRSNMLVLDFNLRYLSNELSQEKC